MVADNEAISNVIEDYVNDVKNAMPIDKVFLFGSFAKGNANMHSDIDLCFFSSSFENQDTFTIVRELFRLSRKYGDFDIEPHAFCASDLETDNPFVKEILRTGKEL
ncbi:MAG: nucleotidyltransferase domain-containing protein [Defluviitaleaceae bacterium]|nr:nucleotidyltransferase domain-containing protein [Defluviitaleaceae bacterium]